jgi:hypothetical protein
MSLIKESTWFLRKSKSQILQLRWRVFGFTNNLWYTSESLLAIKSLVKIRPSNSWDVALPPSKIKLIQVSSATEILRRCMHHNLSVEFERQVFHATHDKLKYESKFFINVQCLAMNRSKNVFFLWGGRPPQPPFFFIFIQIVPQKPTISTYAFYAKWFVNETANKHRNFSAILYLL